MGELRESEKGEAGFTLIELLVVVIIIGLLAAIAIPIFMNQKGKAYDNAARNDIKALAGNQELHLVDSASYGSIGDLVAAGQDVRVSPGVTVTVITYDNGVSYCLSAKHASSTKTFYYDSLAGGLQPSGAVSCPDSTSGTPGDSLTG